MSVIYTKYFDDYKNTDGTWKVGLAQQLTDFYSKHNIQSQDIIHIQFIKGVSHAEDHKDHYRLVYLTFTSEIPYNNSDEDKDEDDNTSSVESNNNNDNE